MVSQKRNGGNYYYKFMKQGKLYCGICEGCTTQREAETYEQQIKSNTAAIVEKQSVVSVANTFRKTIENISSDINDLNAKDKAEVRAALDMLREKVTDGKKIEIANAYELSLAKSHDKNVSPKVIAQKREVFRDFAAFMVDRYPDVRFLADVTASMADEYIAMVRTSGRFNKVLSYVRNGKTITRPVKDTPSSRTANLYLAVCKEVFRLLAKDAGVIDNPFQMKKAHKDEETREAFTEAELKKIYKNLDDFTRPLFTIAITTALREGDICTLKWSDIDFETGFIRRVMNKTGKLVEIPVLDDLCAYLRELKDRSNGSEYVLPEHAKMYLENRSGVTYRVKLFLESLNIQTTRTPKGRTRAVSVKDLHSCRHTFCYYAGLNGIELSTVQAIVGHLTPEMTKHYMAHATSEDKRRAMSKMSGFLKLPTSAPAAPLMIETATTTPAEIADGEPERAQMHQLADQLDIEIVKEIVAKYGRNER